MAKSTLHYTESKAFFSIALWFIPLKFLWFSENKDSCPWAPIPRALLPVLHAEVLLPCSTHCPPCPPRPLLATTSFKNSFAVNKKKPCFRLRSIIWFVSYIWPSLQESVLKFLHAGPFVKIVSRILLSCSCREFWTPCAGPGTLPCPPDTLTYSAPLCPTAEPQTLREGSPYSRAAKVLVPGVQRGKYFPREET